MEQALSVVSGKGRLTCLFKTLDDFLPDPAGITYIPQEQRMLLHAGDAKRIVFGPNGNYKEIERKAEVGFIESIATGDPSGFEVDCSRLSLIELD
jgi:hypothetical protein